MYVETDWAAYEALHGASVSREGECSSYSAIEGIGKEVTATLRPGCFKV